MSALPASVSEPLELLGRGNYVADRSLATAVYLSLSLKRPLLLEGEAGVGRARVSRDRRHGHDRRHDRHRDRARLPRKRSWRRYWDRRPPCSARPPGTGIAAA